MFISLGALIDNIHIVKINNSWHLHKFIFIIIYTFIQDMQFSNTTYLLFLHKSYALSICQPSYWFGNFAFIMSLIICIFWLLDFVCIFNYLKLVVFYINVCLNINVRTRNISAYVFYNYVWWLCYRVQIFFKSDSLKEMWWKVSVLINTSVFFCLQ